MLVMGSIRTWRVLLVTILVVLFASPLSADAAPQHRQRRTVQHHNVRKHPTAAKPHKRAYPHHAAPAKKPVGKWHRKDAK